jgi:hypothetical protein
MALTNADSPVADKPAPAKMAPAQPEPKAPALGRASESGDAGVHNLLAQRDIHASNGHTDAVKAIDDELAELGLAI